MCQYPDCSLAASESATLKCGVCSLTSKWFLCSTHSRTTRELKCDNTVSKCSICRNYMG
jgi:hypothetical protein